MFFFSLFKEFFSKGKDSIIDLLSKALKNKYGPRTFICTIEADSMYTFPPNKTLVAKIKELGFSSRTPLNQPSIDSINDFHDAIGQHLLQRFGPPVGSPTRVFYFIAPTIYSELGFVSTIKLVKHAKANRMLGEIEVVKFSPLIGNKSE